MNQILSLLTELHLAKARLDEQQISEVAKSRSLPDWATSLLNESQLATLGALRDLAIGWRQMDSATFQETMTVAHFDILFTDTLSRMFYRDYNYQMGNWGAYVYNDTAPDFRNVKRFRMTEFENLALRREKQNHRDGSIKPSSVTYGVSEFSRKFDVSWRVILNDDLGKIRETPQRMANAARRTLDSFVSNLYDNTTTQAGLVALGAVYAGTGRLTTANLAVGINAMMQRTDAAGNPIAIRRVTLVIPPVLQVQAAQVLKDIISYGGPNSNVLSDFISGVQVDPYIGFSGANVPWYLFADPSEIPAVTLVRLQGWPGPIVAQKNSDMRLISGSAPAAFLAGDFQNGDIEYMVEDVYGGNVDATYAGVTDPAGIYYSSGTTA